MYGTYIEEANATATLTATAGTRRRTLQIATAVCAGLFALAVCCYVQKEFCRPSVVRPPVAFFVSVHATVTRTVANSRRLGRGDCALVNG